MREVSDEWMAGFWEGEGCVSPISEKMYIIGVAQSITEDRDVVEIMDRIKYTYHGNIYKNFRGKYKTQLYWKITKRKDVVNFIKKIFPYCQFRKQELTNALNIIEKPRGIRELINVDEVKKLRTMGLSYSKIGAILSFCQSSIWRSLHYTYRT